MIARKAAKFIKELNLDTRERQDEIKRVTREQFNEFCIKNGVRNTISSYREYRSVVRSMFGFDLSTKRPVFKCFNLIETNIEFF